MNHQEIFDTVATHLLTQNRRSIDDDGTICMYRGPGDARCAIGCLIPDDLYDPAMERKPVGLMLADFPKLAAVLDPEGENMDLFEELQSVHDICRPKSWREELRVVAKDWNLEWDGVDNL